MNNLLQPAIAAQVCRKLYSCKGTLLGTVTYPAPWDAWVMETGGVRFCAEFQVRSAAILQHWQERGAVRLEGISPAEFELLPECSFAPGAGYIRSLLVE
jgi:hypothetical protein